MGIKVEKAAVKTVCNEPKRATTEKKALEGDIALVKPGTYVPEDAEKFVSQIKTPQKEEPKITKKKSTWQTAKDKLKSFLGNSKPKVADKKDMAFDMDCKNKCNFSEISNKVNGASTGAKCGAVLGGVAAGAVILTCAPALVSAIAAGGFGAVCCGLVGLIGASIVCGAVIGGTLS